VVVPGHPRSLLRAVPSEFDRDRSLFGVRSRACPLRGHTPDALGARLAFPLGGGAVVPSRRGHLLSGGYRQGPRRRRRARLLPIVLRLRSPDCQRVARGRWTGRGGAPST
jgi:hypothetical protein